MKQPIEIIILHAMAKQFLVENLSPPIENKNKQKEFPAPNDSRSFPPRHLHFKDLAMSDEISNRYRRRNSLTYFSLLRSFI